MNLRKLAQGKPCMIRSPLCNYNPDTTVLAHWRDSSTGMGKKEGDLVGAWACSECHDLIDGRNKNYPYEYEQTRLWHLEGIVRTLQYLSREFTIEVKK
jgi:hypothetical protein